MFFMTFKLKIFNKRNILLFQNKIIKTYIELGNKNELITEETFRNEPIDERYSNNICKIKENYLFVIDSSNNINLNN